MQLEARVAALRIGVEVDLGQVGGQKQRRRRSAGAVLGQLASGNGVLDLK